MTYLGEEVVSMAKLTHLFLDHMSLQDLANTAVSKSPSLVHLDMSYNQLRVIQPFSEGSPKLARLNLAGNPIYCNCYLRPLRYSRTLRGSNQWLITRPQCFNSVKVKDTNRIFDYFCNSLQGVGDP